MSSDEEDLMHSDHEEAAAGSTRRKRRQASSSSSDSSSSSSSDSSGSEAEEAEPQQPVTDAREMSVELSSLNSSLTCKLCKGYYREAHTIMDCLHIFCKICLERHIVSTRRNDVVQCPIKGCHSQLIATHPMKTEIRFDRVMQNLVDKLLPKFAAADDEMKTAIAREFGRGEPAAKRTATNGPAGEAAESASKRQKFGDEKFGHEKLMIFELRPYVAPPNLDSSSSSSSSVPPASSSSLSVLPFPFVKTSAKVTVKYLRKFISERIGLPSNTSLDIQCSGEVLGADHSIEFVWRTRWHHLHPNQHLVLTYRLQAHAL